MSKTMTDQDTLGHEDTDEDPFADCEDTDENLEISSSSENED